MADRLPCLGTCRAYPSRLDFCPSRKKQASCLLLSGRLRSLSPPSMAAFLRYRSALSSGGESTTRTPPEASLLLASFGPPSFAFAAIRGGFSSLSLGTLFGMRVHRLAPLQKQASCLLLSGRLRSLSPPSLTAFLRYCSALSSGGESTTRTPPEASLLLASSAPPSFVFAAIRGGFSSLSFGTLFGMRVHRLAPLQKQASCLLLVCRLRSFSPPSVAAFPRYRSALSLVCESIDSHPSRSKPPASFFRGRLRSFSPPSVAAFLRYRSALSSGGESTTRTPSRSKPPACFRGRLRSFSPPSVAAFPHYRSALSSVCESIDSHTLLKPCQNTHAA